MPRRRFGAEDYDAPYGDRGHLQQHTYRAKQRNDVRNKQDILEERLGASEERFTQVEKQLSQMQDRMSKLEESVRRALVDIMPKVEELLARHLTPQPSREAALHVEAPVGASATPSDGRSSTANVLLNVEVPQQNTQLGQHANREETPPRANASTCTKPTECDPIQFNDDGRVTVTPTQTAKGIWWSIFRFWAPPPSGASAATNPPASLHEAAERGDAAAVQRCLAGGAQVDARDTNGNTALHIAASSGRTEVVDILIANGAQVDARDTNGNTALHIAASSGRTEVVDILIANGSAVNRRGIRLRTPLHCAAVKGHEATVALLVTAGAEVDSLDADGATAAALAAQGGHAEVVLWLLDQGTPVEAADKEGRTLLMYAAEGGNIQIVAHLLEQGASPFKEDNNEDFPLLLGSEKGYGNVVGEILKVAATGDTDLLKRCLCVAGSADVVWSFVDEASDLVLGPAGGQALVEAARDGRLEVLEALLRVGAGAKASLEKALWAAAEEGHRCCIVALLDDGVDVNAEDSDYKTALYYADYYGHTKCVNELLRRGAKNN